MTREMILRALDKHAPRKRPGAKGWHEDDPDAEDKFLAQQSHLHLNGMNIVRIANLRGLSTLEVGRRREAA